MALRRRAMRLPCRLRLRGKRKRLRRRELLTDDSCASERMATFDVSRINRRAHHFQRKDYQILQRASATMARELSEEDRKIAQQRPTMSARAWLRRECENYGTWREEAELAEILGGADPNSFIGQEDTDSDSSIDDDRFSIVDVFAKDAEQCTHLHHSKQEEQQCK